LVFLSNNSLDKKPARAKHSSLLCLAVGDEEKKCFNIDTRMAELPTEVPTQDLKTPMVRPRTSDLYKKRFWVA